MLNSGDTAWVLASAALVMLMTPGLAFFYGGMVRSKSVLNMLMMNFIAFAVVGMLWFLYGFRLAFGNDTRRGPSRRLRVRRADRAIAGSPWRPRHRPAAVASRSGRHPRARVLHVPADVRGHHARADLGCGRRPPQVLELDALRRALGDDRLLPGRALGVLVRRVRQRDRGRRLDRRTSSAPWTSPVAPRCTSTPVRRASRSRSCSASARLAQGADAPAQRAARAARREPAVVRLVRVQRGLGAHGRRPRGRRVHQHDGRHRAPRYSAGWSSSRSATASPPRSAPRPARWPAWSPSPRRAGFVSLLGCIIIGLIAGRRLRPGGGLKYRFGFDDSLDVVGVHLVGGLVGTLLIGLFATTASTRRRQRPVLRRWVEPAGEAGGGGGRRAGLLVRRRRRSSARSSTRRSGSGSARRTRSPASTRPSTPNRRTTSRPSGDGVPRCSADPIRRRRGDRGRREGS